MSDLLPCPFCGGEAEWKSGCPGGAWISCKSCPAETDDGTIPRIRDAWNTRALPAVQPDAAAIREAALVEVLKECADDLESYVNHEYPMGLRDKYPSLEDKYAREMEPVVKARALIDNPGNDNSHE